MEKHYQGKQSSEMLADYCYKLQTETYVLLLQKTGRYIDILLLGGHSILEI